MGVVPKRESVRKSVEVSRELILDPKISLAAKGLYGVLLLHPDSSVSHLSRLTGVCRRTVLARLKELERAGWMTRRGKGPASPVEPRKVRERKAAWFRQVLRLTPYIGEFLMFCWLSELIDCDEYVDHARPEFLTNPVTGQPMEYDRMYPSYKKAFECQGPQHYGPTEKFPDRAKAREQELRDWAKLGLSFGHDFELVTITWNDLSLEGMQAKIPSGLPRRTADPADPYVRCLEQESARYRNEMRRILQERPRRTDDRERSALAR